MRKITEHTKRKIFQLWIGGYTYRAISEKLNIGLGSISRIIDEERRKNPDVDVLRGLRLQLQKKGSSLPDALRGATCLERLNQLGISLNEIEEYKTVVERVLESREIAPENFLNAAIKLMRLEAKTKKTYTSIVKEFSEKQREMKDVMKKINSLNAKVDDLNHILQKLKRHHTKAKGDYESTLKLLNELIKDQKRLERLGLNKIGRLAKFVESYESLGYDVEEVGELADLKNVLQEIQVTPVNLKHFIKQKKEMKNQITKLREQLKLLEPQVKILERQMQNIIKVNKRLQAVSEVLKNWTTIIACKYCGGNLIIRLPDRGELAYSISMNQTYSVSCSRCGYANQITSVDMLASIGWFVLM